ncbi:hypothetical protein [Streptomyces canus]|uniref:hypothetical protein n=1 Tax=Streptomyces canus TaxID=58343 RepID=UPI00278918D0|nr:hypothetical protein [Streptomyces canus]MDQ1066262.1 hypothetical protein [Streptomyces canus]
MDFDEEPYSGTKYTVTARAEGGTAQAATFTTRSPGDTFVGYFTVPDLALKTEQE